MQAKITSMKQMRQKNSGTQVLPPSSSSSRADKGGTTTTSTSSSSSSSSSTRNHQQSVVNGVDGVDAVGASATKSMTTGDVTNARLNASKGGSLSRQGSSSASTMLSLQKLPIRATTTVRADDCNDDDDDQSSIISRPFSLLSNDGIDPSTPGAGSSSSSFRGSGGPGFDLHFSLINHHSSSADSNGRVSAALCDVLGDAAVVQRSSSSSSKPKGNKKQR